MALIWTIFIHHFPQRHCCGLHQQEKMCDKGKHHFDLDFTHQKHYIDV